MRSSGLPVTESALLGVGAVDKGSGTKRPICGRDGGEWSLVGSEAECACVAAERRSALKSLRGLELDRVQTLGDGEAVAALAGADGHRGLLGSSIGLEILCLSTAEIERLELDLLLLCIESDSFVNEKARALRVCGVTSLVT